MKKSIQVKRTAIYHYLSNENCRTLLYVIHGYGQLAEDFLKDFKAIEGKVDIVAPEALSRYYNKERKPVASWMTSHEREAEMDDYVSYLDQLHKEISSVKEYDEVKLLGYSQGVSTAMRWLAKSKEVFSHVYLCSGSIPPELNTEDLKHQSGSQFHYFYGINDPLLEVSRAKSIVEGLRGLVEHLDVHPFEGKHEVSDACIDLILQNSESN
ncbi:MAG: hypothetical protein CMP59_01235 [Flavobacteriales bacterium]|nr:hypothetical protein [Flavobacteriales bacterium]|tara:strand:+ start:1545 stop:2177 length:633 start_codon:yes stop_codon:yes gene_type:complete